MKDFDKEKNKRLCKIRSFIGYILNIILIILGMFTIFFGSDANNSQGINLKLYILLILVELLSFLNGSHYNECIEMDYFDGKKKSEILDLIILSKKDSNLKARNELRLGLTILTYVFVLFCFYWAVVSRDILSFIIGICLISISFIYADYIPHFIFYTKRYDEIMAIKNGEIAEPNSIHALARIYFSEYFDNNLKFRRFKATPHNPLQKREKDGIIKV